MVQESLWKLFSMIICVVMLFVIPMMLSYQRQDAISYNLVQHKVDLISEKARESGYIDHAMLVELNGYLSASGYSYDVEFEHLVKAFALDGTTMKVYYEGVYSDTIIQDIESSDRYKMHVGDFFYIRIKNNSQTKSQLFNRIFNITSGGPGIQVISGGIVRYGDT